MRRLLLVSVAVVVCLMGAVALAQQVTLKLWSDWNETSRQVALKEAMKEFESTHPNVKFENVTRAFQTNKQAILTAMSSGNGPDIPTVNNGETMMGPMVRAGDVVNLDPYAKKYGWEKKFLSPSLWARAEYANHGTKFGSGHLYAVPIDGELVGVFYNKAIFKKLGLSVPKTFSEFEQDAAKIKAAGITPIAYGAAEQWPFYHIYGEILDVTLTDAMGAADAENWLNDVVINWDASKSWNNPSVIKAAKILQSWVKKGYFPKGFTGLKIEAALQLFKAGQAAMFIQGSWYTTGIANSPIKAGFFPLPPMEQGEGFPPQVGGMATPLGIYAKSDHQKLAAEFLNTMLSSPKVRAVQVKNDVLVPDIPASLKGLEPGSLYYDLLSTWNKVNKLDRVGQYLDWTTPTMGDTMGRAGEGLLAMKLTPKQFAQKVEADYQKWQANKP
jgi:raffinose/stachyose/melibiose transport system substrate-binding protein